MRAGVRAAAIAVVILGAACGRAPSSERAPVSAPETTTPAPERSTEDPDEYVGFHPRSRSENGMIVMPLVFLDGTYAELVAPPELGIQDMSAAVYTAGGLGGIDRTIDFRYGDGASLMHEGPLGTYEGADGSSVELWHPAPDMPPGCPNLVFRFGDWFAGVRTCQDDLSESEKNDWARLLRGDVTEEGFLVLSATEPLQLEATAGREGPHMYLGMDRANWVGVQPGGCDPDRDTRDGNVRVMRDGTRVTFTQLEDGNSQIEYDWTASWCEDGLIQVQIDYAYKGFAEAAAEDLRLREIRVGS